MIVTEEAIAKGIRRIVAVTGAEAQKVSRSGWPVGPACLRKAVTHYARFLAVIVNLIYLGASCMA